MRGTVVFGEESRCQVNGDISDLRVERGVGRDGRSKRRDRINCGVQKRKFQTELVGRIRARVQ